MRKAKLLIVEDDVNLLASLREIFEMDNYEVMTARDGQQALRLMTQHEDAPPQLIVSDIMMPTMDGFEFLERVRQNPRWVTIPVIYLTAKSDKSDMRQGKFLGVDDYVTKPFDTPDLVAAVEARLKRYQAIDDVQSSRIAGVRRNILTVLNHEFRTPLTLVVAYADMLKEFGEGEMTHEQLLEFLKGVNSGADRLRRLIENFILLVELDTDDFRQRSTVWRHQRLREPESVIQQAIDYVTTVRREPRHFEVSVPAPLPAITGDKEFLSIALRELLDNAAKFSPASTPIEVTAWAEVTTAGEYLYIAVRDHGRGIQPGEVEKIWHSFYQINRDHHEDQGAGVGLAIARGIISLHDGDILVASHPSEGSTFTIALPVRRMLLP
jgi:signal transduction histidine kinase